MENIRPTKSKADETSCTIQVTKVYAEGLILPILKKKDGTRVTNDDFILCFQVRLPLSILRARADSTTVIVATTTPKIISFQQLGTVLVSNEYINDSEPDELIFENFDKTADIHDNDAMSECS